MSDDGDSEAPWIDVSVTVRHGIPHWSDNPLTAAMGAGERVLLRTSNSPRCWQAGEFVEDFACLPVKLHGGDGAPARAILRPITGREP